eukprot:4624350-Prorocentrum_lima.AAC.1
MLPPGMREETSAAEKPLENFLILMHDVMWQLLHCRRRFLLACSRSAASEWKHWLIRPVSDEKEMPEGERMLDLRH